MTSPNFKNVNFFIGIDTHLNNWTVTIRSSGIHLKTFSMNPSAVELHNYLNKHYPNGSFKIVYEAGFAGFSPHRKLKELGLDCIVVNPADIPTTDKEKSIKTDPVILVNLLVNLRMALLNLYIFQKLFKKNFAPLCVFVLVMCKLKPE